MTNEFTARHWDSFYTKSHTVQPTPFLLNCLADTSGRFTIGEEDIVVDLGCGNGRDMLYLHTKSIQAVGIDISKTAVNSINETLGKDAATVCAFSDLPNFKLNVQPTVIYSRFVLHAVTLEDEAKVLQWAANTLPIGGRLLIECRTIYDPLCGKGRQIGAYEYVDGHYRRFLDLNLVERLKAVGFRIRHLVVSNGLAVYEGENPVVMRLALQKA